MSDLDRLLALDEKTLQQHPKQKERILDTLHISQYAFEKAYAYAQIATTVAGRSIECGGYLVAPKGVEHRIATDAFLAQGQIVGKGQFIIQGRKVIEAGGKIDSLGYNVLGWWHSHGFLSTFFSDMDNIGQMNILNGIAGNNYITVAEENPIEDLEISFDESSNSVTLFDKKRPRRKYRIRLSSDQSVDLSAFSVVDEKRIGFAYGLVVNANTKDKDPYAEIATRDFCGYCRGVKDESYSVPVEIFAERVKLNQRQLRKEVKERVRWRKSFWSIPGYDEPTEETIYLQNKHKNRLTGITPWQERSHGEEQRTTLLGALFGGRKKKEKEKKSQEDEEDT